MDRTCFHSSDKHIVYYNQVYISKRHQLSSLPPTVAVFSIDIISAIAEKVGQLPDKSLVVQLFKIISLPSGHRHEFNFKRTGFP